MEFGKRLPTQAHWYKLDFIYPTLYKKDRRVDALCDLPLRYSCDAAFDQLFLIQRVFVRRALRQLWARVGHRYTTYYQSYLIRAVEASDHSGDNISLHIWKYASEFPKEWQEYQESYARSHRRFKLVDRLKIKYGEIWQDVLAAKDLEALAKEYRLNSKQGFVEPITRSIRERKRTYDNFNSGRPGYPRGENEFWHARRIIRRMGRFASWQKHSVESWLDCAIGSNDYKRSLNGARLPALGLYGR